MDPIAYIQARGSAPRSSMDFGIITLAKNPWAEDRLAIVAAGVHGPATAAALQLLTREGAFDKHPFGGVFNVSISNVAHWEERYDCCGQLEVLEIIGRRCRETRSSRQRPSFPAQMRVSPSVSPRGNAGKYPNLPRPRARAAKPISSSEPARLSPSSANSS